ncbi:hypothetical protein BO86DRAFT_146154 [Aspergillus japonicus CBS 114.51]|uniref:Uncharacterized protein n=1 Tax=Aspergillus japonicus CBS 114.51 TaxID=1448312 RepID=A0A8T8WV69_ASPJA|nr:hypothetical protein BO86DRAFT_146154 [Aspergillus japonicus CBS 114.51]RAH79721.1 hypothetical protein BO86DRAFT_146154 [Aspergillus japonicus CBS 114.51]
MGGLCGVGMGVRWCWVYQVVNRKKESARGSCAGVAVCMLLAVSAYASFVALVGRNPAGAWTWRGVHDPIRDHSWAAMIPLANSGSGPADRARNLLSSGNGRGDISGGPDLSRLLPT